MKTINFCISKEFFILFKTLYSQEYIYLVISFQTYMTITDSGNYRWINYKSLCEQNGPCLMFSYITENPYVDLKFAFYRLPSLQCTHFTYPRLWGLLEAALLCPVLVIKAAAVFNLLRSDCVKGTHFNIFIVVSVIVTHFFSQRLTWKLSRDVNYEFIILKLRDS